MAKLKSFGEVKNVDDFIDRTLDVAQRVYDDRITVGVAKEINGLNRNAIGMIGMQLQYCMMKGIEPNIKFLQKATGKLIKAGKGATKKISK